MAMQIQTTFDDLKKEYDHLSRSNEELISSIYYAEYIQKGIFPHERHFNRLFGQDYFLIHKPKGIIGGDLFWIGEKSGKIYFAVGDCTGHSISGAMLSVMAVSFLNYIVLGKEFDQVGDVLDELDKKWIEVFQQGFSHEVNNDWLEIGLCSFDKKSRMLQFAGAFHKLSYMFEGAFHELVGNKYPIGGWQLEENRSFDTYQIHLPETPTPFYLWTDGFKDQFGYITQKRLGSKRLKSIIQEASFKHIQEQKLFIENKINAWQGLETQTDDACMMGVWL
jgi:serine phosphatase RsbU (regulator of sigma subunit)